MDEFKTIKVKDSAIQYLNIVSAITREKQFEVVSRLAKVESEKQVKKLSKSGKVKLKALTNDR